MYFDHELRTTAIATVFHFMPTARPFFTPTKTPTAGGADLARQVGFVAFVVIPSRFFLGHISSREIVFQFPSKG
jgi:hypothetical protein